MSTAASRAELPAAPRVRARDPWLRLPSPLRYAIVLVVLLGIWQAYVSLSHVSPLLVGSPVDVARQIAIDIGNGKIPSATLHTLETLVTGLIIGAVIGFALASLAVFSPVGRDLLAVLTAVLNPLPAIAILPLAIIWFGLSDRSIIFIVTLATIWPVAINTDTGFRTISATTQMVARNLGLRGPRLVIDVLLPAAMPYILTGLKTAWAFGWRTVVAAELVFGVAGSQGGLGWYINTARYYLQTSEIFAGLVVISFLGILVEGLFSAVEARTIRRWGMKR
jgi:NitT/TauT family transport system permease protein